MQTVRVSSWAAFLDLVESSDLLGWAFRGQKQADWSLQSTLSRYLAAYVNPELWAEQEQRALRVFRRKAHSFLNDVSVLQDQHLFRCLALMQHHGGATRLIDFSKSPYVAAFFALEQATEDSAVFALNTPALWHDSAPKAFPSLNREAVDPRSGSNFEDYFLSNRYPLVWPGEPWSMDRRIVAQSGTFVLPGVVDKPIGELLEAYPNAEQLLIKIILPAEIRMSGLNALYRMNITHATLFPDLDGLARSMRYELEVHWQSSSGPPANV